MKKRDFIKLFDNFDDNTEIVVPSTTQFEGYNTITEKIEVFEDNIDGEKVIIIQEKDRLI